METFSESAACLICFEIIEKPIFVGSDAAAKILKNCKTHLHSTITKETLKDVQLKNENEMPLCKNCFDSSWHLTQLNVQLETVQKEISDSTVTFNMTVFQRRSQVYNSQTQNNGGSVKKSSIIELNVSCLPANTFLTKEVHQNVQQFNDKINRNIIIDHQPDDNIEITHVKFESCDLQLEDLKKYCQPTTASVDGEISFSNESQDYNQPGLENAKTSLALPRGVRTTEETESAGSTNLKGDMQGVILEMMKPVKIPQVALKRIKIVKLNGPSTSSCQQKSQRRPELLNTIKFKDNQISNSNFASSYSQGEKRLKCFYCVKTFIIDSERRIHHRTHGGEKPYRCSFCAKRFAQIGNLKRHEKIHTGEKRHECSFCKKRFIQIGQLKTHERTHTGEKPYGCSFCEKQFVTCYEKKCHERIHTGEKPYKCVYCEKTFRQMCHRMSHQKSHNRKQMSVTCKQRKQQRR